MSRNKFIVAIIFLLSSLLTAQQLNNELGVKYNAFSFTKVVRLPVN